MKCLICGFEAINAHSLSGHVKFHGLSACNYKKKFGLERKCVKCGNLLSKNCKKGNVCGRCRDRTGSNNPFFGKNHSAETIEHNRQKNVELSKEKWKNPDYRARVIKGVSKPRREGFGAEQSRRTTQWYLDNPQQRSLRSVRMRKSWEDGVIEPNIHSIGESKKEREMRDKIIGALPERKVEKKTIKVGNRWYLPDVLIDDCVVVEFFGNFWHANPKRYESEDIIHHGIKAKEIWERDKERVDSLSNAGYKVIVVWEDDYNAGFDVNLLIAEIK